MQFSAVDYSGAPSFHEKQARRCFACPFGLIALLPRQHPPARRRPFVFAETYAQVTGNADTQVDDESRETAQYESYVRVSSFEVLFEVLVKYNTPHICTLSRRVVPATLGGTSGYIRGGGFCD